MKDSIFINVFCLIFISDFICSIDSDMLCCRNYGVNNENFIKRYLLIFRL